MNTLLVLALLSDPHTYLIPLREHMYQEQIISEYEKDHNYHTDLILKNADEVIWLYEKFKDTPSYKEVLKYEVHHELILAYYDMARDQVDQLQVLRAMYNKDLKIAQGLDKQESNFNIIAQLYQVSNPGGPMRYRKQYLKELWEMRGTQFNIPCPVQLEFIEEAKR